MDANVDVDMLTKQLTGKKWMLDFNHGPRQLCLQHYFLFVDNIQKYTNAQIHKNRNK